MAEESKEYDFKSAEPRILKFWEKEKVYKFDPSSNKKIFSIDTPPPYISGRMHIGHAFSYSQQDFIIRFKRMKGNSVFYPFGTDDNGLPTERFIEKANNIKSKDMGRTEFIALCLKTLKKETPICIQDFINLGISSDYGLYYSTIDEHSRRISQRSFIYLFKKGEIYNKDFPTMWCPECQTSIAQAELEDKEIPSLFSTIKFSAGGKDLLIATTRPELLPACVAVFVHPQDKRYKSLVGKKAKVPIFSFEVPIIADESANMEKGTGVLMICSYGDKHDAEAINKHKLSPKIILNKDGTLNYGEYKGMKVKDARKKILQDLKEKSLITEQKSIIHAVNVHDKCDTDIEIIPTEQWFIKILDKKKKLIEQGRKIKWHPAFMQKRYENWVNGLEWDWSISRNRHFGVPIPVWKCQKCGEIILPDEKELPVDPLQTDKKCKKCKAKAIPEKMVLDTWATSSLTPQIASELPQVKGKVKIPFSLRPQGHDIIRTWAFYTIVKSYLHENKIPWEDIVISGNVSLGGEKMSKSKGNVIEPQKVIEAYGADSLRFWAASSKLGEDIDYQEKEIVSGKKFVIKIWNAAKFIFQSVSTKKPKKLAETDRLFLSELNKVIEGATNAFENYEYAKAKSDVVNFFWHVFCDDYLELVKKRVYSGNDADKESANWTLYQSLLAVLKMMAPITPYITEEIYQTHFKKFEKEKSVHFSSWPEKIAIKEEKSDAETLKTLSVVLGDIRMEKSKAQKSMKAEIILTLEKEKQKQLSGVMDDLKATVSAKEVREGEFKVEFV